MDSVAIPLDTVQPSGSPKRTLPERLKRYQFTPETARVNAAKGLIVRRLRSNPPAVPAAHAPTKPADESFRDRMLVRVRKQMSVVFDRLAEQCASAELDAAAIDRLASAFSRLEEVEQKFSGRRNPGTEKPGPVQAPSRSLLDGPL